MKMTQIQQPEYFSSMIDEFDQQQRKVISGIYSYKLHDKEWMDQIVIRYISFEFKNQHLFPQIHYLFELKVQGQIRCFPFIYISRPQHVTLGSFKGTRRQFLQLYYDISDILKQQISISWIKLLNIKSNDENKDLLAFQVKAQCYGIRGNLFIYLNEMIRKRSLLKHDKPYLPHVSYGYVPKEIGQYAAPQIQKYHRDSKYQYQGFYLYIDKKYKQS